MVKKKYLVSKKRTIHTYSEIWRASYWTLWNAQNENKGSHYQIMASLIFTAFALEAYLNHVGQRVFRCWHALERLSPQGKMSIIAEKLNVKIDSSKRPFQTIKNLFDFRNELAHGKTISLHPIEEVIIADEILNEYMHNAPKMEWEKYCNLKNAERARVDVEKVMLRFHKAAGITDEPLFPIDSWVGLVKIIH